MAKTMQVGFVGLDDPRSIRSYSGTPYFMAHALEQQGCRMAWYLHLEEKSATPVRLKNKLFRRFGRHVVRERDPRIARHYPEQISAAAENQSVDAVVGTSSFYMRTVKCPVPAAFWGDTTFAGVLNSYPYYRNLTRRSIRDCHRLEQAALSSSAMCVFSNQWAADVACAHYLLDENKLRVIPYGANLFTTPKPREIAECMRARRNAECELLLVGVDWERKGAQLAIDAASALRSYGLDARLTIVGCVPPPGHPLPEFVRLYQRIDKATREGQTLMATLYLKSHIFILPSRAECAAISLAEASAHAVPSLSTDVGGNRTLVKDGVNGTLFPLEAEGADYARYIFDLLADPCAYEVMCWNSFRRYEAELNWEVASSRFITELNGVLEDSGGSYACAQAC